MCTKRIRQARAFTSFFIIWILVLSVVVPSASAFDVERDKLYLGGFPFGARIRTDGALVVAVREVDSQNGIVAPARDAGILAGDIIKKVNGREVLSCADVSDIISSGEGNEVTLDIFRNGKVFSVKITPVLSRDGQSYKSGLWIRDGAAGIGTVTYVIPDTLEFGGLGHGICDTDTGALVPFGTGLAYPVSIHGITKGEKGKAGEIRGQLNETENGSLRANTQVGVFGEFDEIPDGCTLLSVAKKDDVRCEPCTVYTTLDGNTLFEAEARILKLLDTKGDIKNFLIEITDKKLIDKTGGIVQGMSGSPIVQNGKLIGAVTHVLVDEPSRGYGIFIENMLAEAEKIK